MKVNIYFVIILMLFVNSTYAVEVSKKEWINSMTTALPTAFCNSSQYFRQCYKVSAQECEEVAASATRVCINKYKNEIPGTLIQPKDGARWGTTIGTCAGEAYGISLTKKYVGGKKCNNIENWR